MFDVPEIELKTEVVIRKSEKFGKIVELKPTLYNRSKKIFKISDFVEDYYFPFIIRDEGENIYRL